MTTLQPTLPTQPLPSLPEDSKTLKPLLKRERGTRQEKEDVRLVRSPAELKDVVRDMSKPPAAHASMQSASPLNALFDAAQDRPSLAVVAAWIAVGGAAVIALHDAALPIVVLLAPTVTAVATIASKVAGVFGIATGAIIPLPVVMAAFGSAASLIALTRAFNTIWKLSNAVVAIGVLALVAKQAGVELRTLGDKLAAAAQLIQAKL
jgi:hypothetical protein